MTSQEQVRVTQAFNDWRKSVFCTYPDKVLLAAFEAGFLAHRQAAEAEAKAREAWQPIETAPKEIEGALYAAPRLLLLVPPYGAFTGCWGRNPEYPWGGDWSVPGLLNKEARPTHWMPLPAPPEPQP